MTDPHLQRQKQKLCEKLWLLYFNDYLYSRGEISEQQHTRMITLINQRKG